MSWSDANLPAEKKRPLPAETNSGANAIHTRRRLRCHVGPIPSLPADSFCGPDFGKCEVAESLPPRQSGRRGRIAAALLRRKKFVDKGPVGSNCPLRAPIWERMSRRTRWKRAVPQLLKLLHERAQEDGRRVDDMRIAGNSLERTVCRRATYGREMDFAPGRQRGGRRSMMPPVLTGRTGSFRLSWVTETFAAGRQRGGGISTHGRGQGARVRKSRDRA